MQANASRQCFLSCRSMAYLDVVQLMAKDNRGCGIYHCKIGVDQGDRPRNQSVDNAEPLVAGQLGGNSQNGKAQMAMRFSRLFPLRTKRSRVASSHLEWSNHVWLLESQVYKDGQKQDPRRGGAQDSQLQQQRVWQPTHGHVDNGCDCKSGTCAQEE